MIFRQVFIVVGLSVILGLGLNTVSPNKIDVVGKYRSLSSGNGPIVPPTASEGDPPFIAIDLAELEHSQRTALFIDTRERKEFECGTIPGSVNIPFEYLPEENLEQYIDSALGRVPFDQALIAFCSGEECELSLHMGRNLQAMGYTNIAIFFGGSMEWEKFGLELERRSDCADL